MRAGTTLSHFLGATLIAAISNGCSTSYVRYINSIYPALNWRANGRRIFGLVSLSLIIVILPATAHAAVFNQREVDQLVEIGQTIQSLTRDVANTLHNLPRYEAERIRVYAFVELNLEAIRERWNTVFFLVLLSSTMETSADEARILYALHEEVLPKGKEYVTAKKNAIVRVGRAQSDSLLSSYSGRAANII